MSLISVDVIARDIYNCLGTIFYDTFISRARDSRVGILNIYAKCLHLKGEEVSGKEKERENYKN